MERIHNNRELFHNIGFLRLLEKALADKQFGDPDGAAQMITDLKRSIRAYCRKHRTDYDTDPRIIKDDGIDGYIVLIAMPNYIESKEEADEWFKDHEYLRIRYSAYDCTGDLFTRWFKIITRRGRFYAYHSIGCDC